MKYSDIKDMTVEELRKKEKAMRQELFDLKMKHSLGQITNPIEIRDTRKSVAQVKTALTAKLR